MLEILITYYAVCAKWLNDNQGVTGVSIFIITLLFGWGSGIFSALRRKPKFKLSLIAGPTFCCTFPTGASHGDFPVHRTGIALYLSVSNVGSAASSISSISIAYHWSVRNNSLTWLRYGTGWFWLHEHTAIIHDFPSKIGENIKFYPFLVQRSIFSGSDSSTFLEPGRSTNGVVYFEQTDSWGGCFPVVSKPGVRVKVSICDVFGSRHTKKFLVQAVSLKDARKYNPSFGKTHAELRNETLPHDENIPQEISI